MKIKLTLVASILLLVSLQANASLVGIDVLSESNHIWGQSRIDFPSTGTFSYDLVSNDPISFSTNQVSLPISRYSEAEAGDFRVQTDTASVCCPTAYAQSTYKFTPEMAQLSLHAYGEGGGWFNSYDLSYSTISLLDMTTDYVLLSGKFGEAPEGTNLNNGWHYSFDEMYLFDVNPDHIYELSLFSLTGGGDLRIGDTILQAELSVVPIPAAFWLFGTALLGLVGFSKRKQAA